MVGRRTELIFSTIASEVKLGSTYIVFVKQDFITMSDILQIEGSPPPRAGAVQEDTAVPFGPLPLYRAASWDWRLYVCIRPVILVNKGAKSNRSPVAIYQVYHAPVGFIPATKTRKYQCLKVAFSRQGDLCSIGVEIKGYKRHEDGTTWSNQVEDKGLKLTRVGRWSEPKMREEVGTTSKADRIRVRFEYPQLRDGDITCLELVIPKNDHCRQGPVALKFLEWGKAIVDAGHAYRAAQQSTKDALSKYHEFTAVVGNTPMNH